MVGGRDTTTFRSAIQGYGLVEWVEESKWSESMLSPADQEYYAKVAEDFALIITTSKGISLRHVRGMFQTHCYRVDLERLQMTSWRTLIVSLRNIIDFKENTLTGEVFVFPSDLGKENCPSHLQSLMIATPSQPGDPNVRHLQLTTCKDVFFAGILDTVNGALVDPRVPNQSAQIATKEDIEAKSRPQPPSSFYGVKGKWPRGKAGKLTFEEQVAPKAVREMCTAVALGPTEIIQDPEVASVNLAKLLAHAHAKDDEDHQHDSTAEGSRGPTGESAEDATASPRRHGAPSETGSYNSSNGSNSRPARMPRKKATLDYVPVAEVHTPSTFHLRFKPSVQAAAVPFASEEERLAARQAVNLRDTDYEKRIRDKLAKEEAEKKKREEQLEQKIRAEEEERRRGLAVAEAEVARQNREKKEAAKKQEERIRQQEAREAARQAEEHQRELKKAQVVAHQLEEQRQLLLTQQASKKVKEERRLMEAREAARVAEEKRRKEEEEEKKILGDLEEVEALLCQLGRNMKIVRDQREALLRQEEAALKREKEEKEREKQLARRREEQLARQQQHKEAFARLQEEEAAREREKEENEREDKLAREREEQERREREEAEARAREEAEARAREEAEARAREEAEARAREEAEAREREEADARARQEEKFRQHAEQLAREQEERMAQQRKERMARRREEQIARERKEEFDRLLEEQAARERAEEEARQRQELAALEAFQRQQEEAEEKRKLCEAAVRHSLRRVEALREMRRNSEIQRQEEEKALERQRAEIARKKKEEEAILKQIEEIEAFQRMVDGSL